MCTLLHVTAVLPGTSSPRGSVSPVYCRAPGHVLSPWFGEPRRLHALAVTAVLPGTSSARGSESPGACARSVASAVLPGRVLNPVRQLLLSWLSVPTRSNAVDALVCPESSGLITSCAAYPRDPVRHRTSNPGTVCPLQVIFKMLLISIID
jgi:hypothetical protein